MNEEKEKNMSKKVESILEEVSSLSLLEASELVKAMEEKFGVTASAPVMAVSAMVGAQAPAQQGGTDSSAEEKSEYKVTLVNAGAEKIKVIKALRTINQNLGLKEAKDMVDNAPSVVSENAKKEEAENMVKLLKEAGAEVKME